jgi:hypothetical protein
MTTPFTIQVSLIEKTGEFGLSTAPSLVFRSRRFWHSRSMPSKGFHPGFAQFPFSLTG